MIAGKMLSFSVGVMDRLTHLLATLPCWLSFPEIDEILVVDFASSLPVREALARAAIGDYRLRIVRVEDERYWSHVLCHNLEWRESKGFYLLRTDADVLPAADFFRRACPESGQFLTGDWRDVRSRNEAHLTGTIFVARSAFLAVNGYHEDLLDYGWEDDDLYDRLEKAGFQRKFFAAGDLWHIPHTDHDRLCRMPGFGPGDAGLQVGENEPDFPWQRFGLGNLTDKNRKLAFAKPWTSACRLSRWMTMVEEPGYKVVRRER